MTISIPSQRRLAFYVALALTSVATALLLFPLPIDPARAVSGGDKWIHGALFAALAGCWAWAGWSPRRMVVAGALFAVATESLQHFAGLGRHGDPLDALADMAGVGLVAIAWAWRRRQSARSVASAG